VCSAPSSDRRKRSNKAESSDHTILLGNRESARLACARSCCEKKQLQQNSPLLLQAVPPYHVQSGYLNQTESVESFSWSVYSTTGDCQRKVNSSINGQLRPTCSQAPRRSVANRRLDFAKAIGLHDIQTSRWTSALLFRKHWNSFIGPFASIAVAFFGLFDSGAPLACCRVSGCRK